MKKALLLIIGLALVGTAVYFAANLPIRPDETKTEASLPPVSEDNSLTTIEQELSATTLEDFDQQVQTFDQSISQL
jgi:hypothetical protein